MADYFPVLSRAVAGLETNTGESRRAVYDRARAAIVRQLRSIEPPLSEEDIARERMQLEEAIRKVEANSDGAAAPASPAEGRSSPPQQQPQRPEAPRPTVGPAPGSGRPAGAKPGPAGPSVGARQESTQAAPEQRQPVRADGRPVVRAAGQPGAEPRRRSAPLIALAVLALIAICAGLFAARGQIAALFGGGSGEVAVNTPAESPAPAPPAQTDAATKTDDRLLNDPPAEPQNDQAQSEQPRGAPAAEPQAPPPPSETEVARGPEPTAPAPEAPAPATQPAQPAPPPAAAPTRPASPGPLVAQRAILYEEGADQQSGEQIEGSVVWRTESVSGGQNQPLETALRGDIDIPGRNLQATLSIRRNIDATLPASHTIELQFKLPENFPNAGIANVPGILMKADEAARGAAVAGLSVRVTNGFFLIGLSNLDTERTVNEQLLRDRGWIDVPILYDNGRRAVLTLEKGSPGAQAFADAFEAWQSASVGSPAQR
jgi:hypothetical protein